MVNRSREWEKKHRLVCLDELVYENIKSKKGKRQTFNEYIKHLTTGDII